MDNEKKLASLEEMMLESFANRPEQANEAIEEYLENLEEENKEKASNLKTSLKDKGYFEQFKQAITQTSLILFLISIKTSNDILEEDENLIKDASDVEALISTMKIDLDRYVREYLLFARKDDLQIYEMRMFYLDSLTGEEWVGMEMDEETDGSVGKKVKRYNELLNSFKKQYKESKIHLLQ